MTATTCVVPACGSEERVSPHSDAGQDADGATVRDAAPATTTDVACGYLHACALLSDGATRCWGRLTTGDAPTDRAGPFVQVSTGFYTCGLAADGSQSCWDGATSPPISGPFVAISQSLGHGCALRKDGSAVCFTLQDPVEVENAPVALKSVSAGVNGPCGIEAAAGKASCWTPTSPSPAPADAVTALSVGGSYACAVLADGSLTCWGKNLNGELNAPSGAFVDVKASVTNACALRADGSLACWGVFGGGLTTPYSPMGAFRKYCVGDTFACGILTSGGITCWGENKVGQATPPSDLR